MGKKIVSLVVALMLVLTSMSFAFAATTTTNASVSSDITDAKVKAAVDRLVAFGLINGMDDGKYHPEEKLTREQAAKIIVEALGLGSAATVGMGPTQFTDVAADRWSSGYINVATGQGLIKGMGDGTFAPDAQVTYAQVLTMLVRAVGYKDELLPGVWPQSYVAKAADLDITDEVSTFTPDGIVDRGAVAIMVNNTLDANVLKITEYENGQPKYSDNDQPTLLADKLKIDKYEDTRLMANRRIDDGLNNDEVTVKWLSDEAKNRDGGTQFETKDYTLADDSVNTEALLGQEATIYVNDDGDIAYIEDQDDDSAVYDFVEGVSDEEQSYEDTVLSLNKLDDDYNFVYATGDEAYDKGTCYVLNDDDKYDDNEDMLTSANLLGKEGRFVVKNNKIVWAEIFSAADSNNSWFVVTANDSGVLSGVAGDDDSFEIDLTADGDYDGTQIYDFAGNTLQTSDIAEGDMIYIQKQSIDGDDIAVVFDYKDGKVTGSLDSEEDDGVTISGEDYDVLPEDATYYSVDANDSVSVWAGTDWENDMEDADAADVTAYLEPSGMVAYLTTTAEATSGTKYGVVEKVNTESESLKVWTNGADGGDAYTYDVDDWDDITSDAKELDANGLNATDSSAIAVGDLVKFKLNKDNAIADNEIFKLDKTNFYVMSADFGSDTMKGKLGGVSGTSASFTIEDDAVILDLRGFYKDTTYSSSNAVEDEDFGLVKWSELSGDDKLDVDDSQFYVFADSDNNPNDITGLIFVGDTAANTTSDQYAGYVYDRYYKGGDYYVKVKGYDRDDATLKVDDSDEFNSEERPYVYKILGNGNIAEVSLVSDLTDGETSDGFSAYFGQITEKKSDYITADVYKVGTHGTILHKTFTINSKTVVYEKDDPKTNSNLAADDYVYIVVRDGSQAQVIEKVTKDSEKEQIAEWVNPYDGDSDQ